MDRGSKRYLVMTIGLATLILFLSLATIIWGEAVAVSALPRQQDVFVPRNRLGHIPHQDEIEVDLGLVPIDEELYPVIAFDQNEKRWPFPSTFAKYRAKGCRLWTMLEDRNDIPETSYIQVGDMTTWGWINTPINTAERISSLLDSIKTPMESLGLSISADYNVDIHSDHSAQGGPDKDYSVSTSTISSSFPDSDFYLSQQRRNTTMCTIQVKG